MTAPLAAHLDLATLERDPYPAFAALQAHEPVAFVPSLGMWLVTRWDDVVFVCEDAAGHQLRVGVTGDRDPGYGSTSKMITEAAVCLLQECADTPGGIWTPAAAMGQRLIERLQANAGLSFSVEPA